MDVLLTKTCSIMTEIDTTQISWLTSEKIDLNDVSVFLLSSNIFSRSRLSEKDTRIFMFDLYFYRLCPIPNSNLFTECSYVWRVMDAKQETFILLTKPVSNIWIHAISSIYVYSLTCWFTRFKNCRSTDAYYNKYLMNSTLLF